MNSLFTSFKIKDKCHWKPNPFYQEYLQRHQELSNKSYSNDFSDIIQCALDTVELQSYNNSKPNTLFINQKMFNRLMYQNSKDKSKFILELEGNAEQLELKKCPNCISADLIKRSGITNKRRWAFWGCSNYAYGCEFQEWA